MMVYVIPAWFAPLGLALDIVGVIVLALDAPETWGCPDLVDTRYSS
jgi:hypothetical protein